MLLVFSRKFFRHFWFYSQNVSAVQISTGKILGFPTFVPDFFSFFNFRPEIFTVFQISNRKKFPETQERGSFPQ
jgi:hypothetical protein